MKKDIILGIIGIILSLLVSAWLLVFIFDNFYIIFAVYWLQLFVIFYIHRLENLKWYVACISSLILINIINIVGIIIWGNYTVDTTQVQMPTDSIVNMFWASFANTLVEALFFAIIMIPAVISAIIIIIECLVSIGIRVYKHKKNKQNTKQELS